MENKKDEAYRLLKPMLYSVDNELKGLLFRIMALYWDKRNNKDRVSKFCNLAVAEHKKHGSIYELMNDYEMFSMLKRIGDDSVMYKELSGKIKEKYLRR
ncbi:hypothetical protein KAW48_11505 [candidate division WOR-3 bacterium]|nr:hypothetical protein [candidate division WOR-3 bacterium]